MRYTRQVQVLIASLTIATLLGGCGGGIKAPDLFIVTRSSGQAPAKLTVLVNQEGGVTCNAGPTVKLSDPQLLEARAIQEDLHDQASQHRSLTPQPGSVFSYYLRDVDGTVRFSDNSKAKPAVFDRLSLFVLKVAQEVCHLPG